MSSTRTWAGAELPSSPDLVLRSALEAKGQRYTGQRSAVYRFLRGTRAHPTADDVFTAVRAEIPDISLATVYKSLEALVGCGLAAKLTYGDAAARYDARTDQHPHARCTACGAIVDVDGSLEVDALAGIGGLGDFVVESYRLELVGRCGACATDA